MNGWNLKGSFNEITTEKKDETLSSYKCQGIMEIVWKNT